MTEQPVRPILALEAGSSRFKAALVVPLDDGHHVCGQVSLPVETSVKKEQQVEAATRLLEQMTGWRLDSDRSVVITAPRETPLPERRVVIAPAHSEHAERMAGQLRSRGYVTVVGTLTDSGRIQQARGEAEEAGVSRPVDAIVVSAGSSREAASIGAVLSAADSRVNISETALLFAGPDDAAKAFEEQLPADLKVFRVSTSEWTKRSVSDAAIDRGLLADSPESDSTDTAKPTPAFQVCDVLASTLSGSVCLVDVGGGTSSISMSHGEGERKKHPRRQGFVALGTSAGLKNVLRTVPPAEIHSWIPFDLSDSELEDYLANRVGLGSPSPQDTKQLMVEQAVARAAGRRSATFEVGADFIIASGGLASFPRLSQTVLATLDIAQPVTPCRVLVDGLGLLPRFESIARKSGEAALSLLKSDMLVNAGVCLSLLGRAGPGESVAEIGVSRVREDGEQGEEEVFNIRFGTITVIPLASDEQGALRITTGRRHSFGIEPSHRPWATKTCQLPRTDFEGIGGGLLGLVVDARGRPISLEADQAMRQARLAAWMTAMDAYDSTVFSSLD